MPLYRGGRAVGVALDERTVDLPVGAELPTVAVRPPSSALADFRNDEADLVIEAGQYRVSRGPGECIVERQVRLRGGHEVSSFERLLEEAQMALHLRQLP